MERLRQSLELYNANTLKIIAESLNVIPPRPNVRKAWLVDALDVKIREVAKSPAFIQVLSQAERALLGILLKNGGTGTSRAARLPLMMANLIYIEDYAPTRDLPRFRDVLRMLMRRGLVINLSEPPVSSSRRTFDAAFEFGIPPEIVNTLPRNLLPYPKPRPDAQTIPEPPRVEHGDPEQYLRQLFFMWAELRRVPAKRLKSGRIGKRDLRRIAKSIGVEFDDNAEHIREMQTMLQALNLVEMTPDAIGAADSDAVKLFWDASPRMQMVNIVQAYPNIGYDVPMDLRSLSDITYYASYPVRLSSDIRTQILDLLKEGAAANWFPYALFLAFICGGRDGSLAFSDHTLNTLYKNVRWYAANYRTRLDNTLQKLDRQIVNAVLKEMQGLGIVDLGYASQESSPTALRLTPLARAHFTNQHIPPPDVVGQVVLQPDFQILAMGPVPLSELANLERFAVREKLDESVVTYRLTRDSAYLAFQRGESPQSIVAFLEEATAQPVPQNIARTLEDWGGQYERIVVRREVTIMQVDDAAVLDKLLADSRVRRYLHRLDNHTAWLRAKSTPRIESRLRKLAMLPTYSQGPDADLPHSLVWDGDDLRPRHPLPSLYVTGSIRRVAESAGDHFRLTPQSVRAAVTTGMDVPSIIALIERVTGTALPPDWHKQLKAWGNHFGDGQVTTVTLLHLESDAALQELRRLDRRLSRLIRPLPDSHGIGIVADTRRDEVQALLAEWGIAVDEKRWW